MGFKTLRDFNLAMLAKQVWRFHTKPHSLISRCFKAKYFPQSDILQASLGYNPSYVWRSIHNSIWVILKGSYWKIGNGESAKVWGDNWVPLHNGFKILTKEMEPFSIRHVKDLINMDSSSWDTEILNNLFLPIDKDHIEQIPIINTTNIDEYMWMHEPTGVYTVKSGYKDIKEWQGQQSSSTASSSCDTQVWKKLWAINTIP